MGASGAEPSSPVWQPLPHLVSAAAGVLGAGARHSIYEPVDTAGRRNSFQLLQQGPHDAASVAAAVAAQVVPVDSLDGTRGVSYAYCIVKV